MKMKMRMKYTSMKVCLTRQATIQLATYIHTYIHTLASENGNDVAFSAACTNLSA